MKRLQIQVKDLPNFSFDFEYVFNKMQIKLLQLIEWINAWKKASPDKKNEVGQGM